MIFYCVAYTYQKPPAQILALDAYFSTVLVDFEIFKIFREFYEKDTICV